MVILTFGLLIVAILNLENKKAALFPAKRIGSLLSNLLRRDG